MNIAVVLARPNLNDAQHLAELLSTLDALYKLIKLFLLAIRAVPVQVVGHGDFFFRKVSAVDALVGVLPARGAMIVMPLQPQQRAFSSAPFAEPERFFLHRSQRCCAEYSHLSVLLSFPGFPRGEAPMPAMPAGTSPYMRGEWRWMPARQVRPGKIDFSLRSPAFAVQCSREPAPPCAGLFLFLQENLQAMV